MTACVVVARRSDGGQRDRLWAWVRPWWEAHGWTVVEGHHDDGPWCKARALAAAMDQLPVDWTSALHIDADVILANPENARRAVEIAERTRRLTYAHDRWCTLGPDGTDRVLDGEPVDDRWVRTRKDLPVSQCLAIPRRVWELTGGMDARFTGWGWEDVAFDRSAVTLGGGTERLHGDLYHLWHPRNPARNESDPSFQANRALGRRYKRAAGDVDAIRALLTEPGAPLAHELAVAG